MNTGTASQSIAVKATCASAPSAAQMKLLLQVKTHTKANGIAPSFEELGAALGCNKSAVSQTVSRLRRDGFLMSDRAGVARYRNLALTHAGERAIRAFLKANPTAA